MQKIGINIGKMTGLMDMYLYFTSLHGNIPSDFCLIKDLRYLFMEETHIHDTTPADLYNMQQIKYLSVEASHPNTQFLYFPR